MDNHYNSSSQPKSDFFSVLPSKQAFWLGFITAILTIGTVGFVILGGAMLNGGVNLGNGAGNGAAALPQPGAAAYDGGGEADTVPPGTVPVVTAEDHIRGNADAPITIIEYSDFECPFCSRFHPTVQQALDNYGDKVRWVYRHFPLSFHPNAESAANASECAGEQGKFWEFTDGLFENQGTLSESFYNQLAGQLGLNASQFSNCVSSNKYIDKVREQAQTGGAAGVTGTPGSFVIDQDGNAVPLRGALPYDAIAQAIDGLL